MSHPHRRALRLSVCAALAWLCLVPLTASVSAQQPTPAALAADGKALRPVVVAKNASSRTQAAARTLAAYLGRISGAKFAVAEGDGRAGIAVGLPEHFPAVGLKNPWDAKDPTRTEDYLLRSHAAGVHVFGASDLAVEHAVWDLLYRLGHRQFFPGDTWEVVPNTPQLNVAVDVREHPSYYARRIWYGGGVGKWAAEPYAAWCARNRATSGIVLNTGHAYEGIRKRHQAEFDQHPEYLALVNGTRRPPQFCLSNPELRRLVVADALAQFAKNPALHSVSVDPADGAGWCTCEHCQKMGSPSDRAVLLANEVAEAVEAKYPGKYVGLYAYSSHSPPPRVKVHPRVVINVATGFIQGGYSVDQLLEGWQKRGATVGIREYYSVHTWDRDLPGRARGANLAYLQKTIPHFHDRGARFMSAESSDNWGPNGLGYYLAARMLWDVREAKNLDALKADFFEKAFGPAREPMAEYYRLIDAGNRPLLCDDLIGRLYRQLADAHQRTTDPKIRARLADLTLYTRYLELWTDYSTATGAERQQGFEALVRHGNRVRKSMMLHTVMLVRDLAARDKSVTLPKEASRGAPDAKNPWLSNEPFTAADIDALVKNGIANRKLLDFQPVNFSANLVLAGALRFPEVTPGNMGALGRGTRQFYTWADKMPATLGLHVTAGLIYQNRGPAKLALYPKAEPEGKAVDQAEAAPDKTERAVTLRTTLAGLQRLEVADGTAGTRLRWTDGVPMTVQSSPESPISFNGSWTLYFYVPKGTKVVGGFASGGKGTLRDGGGKAVYTFEPKAHYFSVPVPPGQDGKLWRFQQCSGQRLLMTVPPYLARSGAELLLPVEVVEKDAAK
jgi:hypothetical protein